MIKAILGAALIVLAAAPALADVKAGVEAWERGDYSKAVADWRGPAVAGDADAQFNLGQAYKLARGVPFDLSAAEAWYHKAAVQGHLQAEDNYGLTLFQNGKRAEAMPWIAKSAARGEGRAQYVLATASFNGDLAPKDWIKAYALMTRASASGVGAASSSLAQMDRYIPVDQRQKGLAMARDLEVGARRPEPAPFSSPPVELAGGQPTPSAIQSTDIPPSQPAGAPYAPPAAAPVKVAVAPVPAPRPATPPPAAAKPIKALPVPAGKSWRVQLGAFGSDAAARSLWASLSPKLSGFGNREPLLVKAGAMTRLQAGPFASKAGADQACTAAKKAGAPCFPVAP